jgi:hypothetical protein
MVVFTSSRPWIMRTQIRSGDTNNRRQWFPNLNRKQHGVSNQSWANDDIRKMKDRTIPSPSDGLFLILIKLACRPFLAWHSSFYIPFLVRMEPSATRVTRWFFEDRKTNKADSDEGCIFRLCADAYLVIVFVFLLVAYTIIFFVARFGFSRLSSAVIGVLLLSCLLRAYEILAFIALLHSRARYKSASFIRALINTIWHYAEMTLIFGVCYLACSYFFGDRFTSNCEAPSILSQFINAMYFSFVSLATIGYGDFSPQTQISKVLVMIEGFVGLFLLVIVLQRAMSAPPEPERCSDGSTRTKPLGEATSDP